MCMDYYKYFHSHYFPGSESVGIIQNGKGDSKW